MLMKLTDVNGNEVWFNPASLNAVVIPSLLAEGDGRCKVIITNVVSDVTRAEAQRLLDVVIGN